MLSNFSRDDMRVASFLLKRQHGMQNPTSFNKHHAKLVRRIITSLAKEADRMFWDSLCRLESIGRTEGKNLCLFFKQRSTFILFSITSLKFPMSYDNVLGSFKLLLIGS